MMIVLTMMMLFIARVMFYVPVLNCRKRLSMPVASFVRRVLVPLLELAQCCSKLHNGRRAGELIMSRVRGWLWPRTRAVGDEKAVR